MEIREIKITPYVQAKNDCMIIFTQKLKDYGVAFRYMHETSFVDLAIRNGRALSGVHETKKSYLECWAGLTNWTILAAVRRLSVIEKYDERIISQRYEDIRHMADDIVKERNGLYCNEWKRMRIESLADIAVMKLLRAQHLYRSVESSAGAKIMDSLLDTVNYGFFGMARVLEETGGHDKIGDTPAADAPRECSE